VTAVAIRRLASDTRFVHPGRPAVIAVLSMACYVVSTIKFQTRDPLSTQAGIQAALELALVSTSFVLAASIASPRLVWQHLTPTVIGFVLFTGFALLSSVFSFLPMLSLIKGGLLLVTLAIATILCASRPPREMLTTLYWLVFAILVIGTLYKLVSSQPLFDADEYSGRMRFTLFALHWGSLADFVAYTFFLGRLLPRRPHWACQGLLLVANLAAGARASTGALIIVLVGGWVWNQRKVTARGLALATFGVAGLALAALVLVNIQVSASSIPYERFYGDKVTVDELVTLNNRTNLWAASLPLIPGSLVFGYGVEGMRAALLQEFDWAGHSHNAYLELLFASGLPGLIAFAVAWGSAIARTGRARRDARVPVIGLHIYMFLCGLTDPNLMLLQYFPIFLIVCLDAFVRAEVAAPEPAGAPASRGHAAAGAWALQLRRRTT